MELRHLRYFVAVAEELHFGRAAARLNIAAPTLSQQIGALENILGAKLFARRTKSAVALTHAGQRFLVEAQETLKQAARAELVGRRAGRGEVGSIAIGYLFSAGCSGLVGSTLRKFRSLHPDVSFQMRRIVTFAQYKALNDGSIDVGFAHPPHQRYPSGLTGFIIDRQPFWLVMPEGHRLAARKQITPAMLINEDFVAMSLEMEAGFWGNIAAITPPGASLRIVDRAPDAFGVMTMISAGLGVSVLSEPITNVGMKGVVARRIDGVKSTADTAVVYRRNESAPVVKNLIDFLRAEAREAAHPARRAS